MGAQAISLLQVENIPVSIRQLLGYVLHYCSKWIWPTRVNCICYYKDCDKCLFMQTISKLTRLSTWLFGNNMFKFIK
jgi:hypothetical protein